MEYSDLIKEAIEFMPQIYDKKSAKLYLIKEYSICKTFANTDILCANSNIFFINNAICNPGYILFKDSQYYLMDSVNLTPINPIAQYKSIKADDIKFYSVHSTNLGNAIYISEEVGSKYLHLLIYFDEICKPYRFYTGLFLLGDRIIRPFCDVDGNITVFDNLGNVVPYHTIECPGKKTACAFYSNRFSLHMYTYKREDRYDFTAEYTARSTQTKAAPRLAEHPAD